MKNFIKKTNLLLMILFIGSIIGSIGQFSGVAAAYDCSTLAAVDVTTSKITYLEGETVTGNFVLTNYTNATIYLSFTGDLYENDVLVYTNSVNLLVYPGENSFDLTEIFGTLDSYINALGSYRIEVYSSTKRGSGCTWSDIAYLTVESGSTPEPPAPPPPPPTDTCSIIASVDVTTGKTTYIEGETVTGNFVLSNYTGASTNVSFTGYLYENDVLVNTNSVDLMVYPGTNSFNLTEIFGPLDNYIKTEGSYKIEVSSTTSLVSNCIWADVASLTVEAAPAGPIPPTADAGPDQAVADSEGSGAESVILDGSGSFDSDGSIVAYEWKEGTTVLGTSASITVSFAVGVHTVKLTVTDDAGAADSDTVVVTVDPYSPPPPVDTCSTLASVNVTTGKATYSEGETVTGNFVLSNYTNVTTSISFTGDLYENDALIYSNSVNLTVSPGANSFSLTDLFGTLNNYIYAEGSYRIDIDSSTPLVANCNWTSSASLTVEAGGTPPPPPPPPPPATEKLFPALSGVNIGSPHNYDEFSFQQQLAKRDIIVLNLYKGWGKGGKNAAQVVQEIKSLNPNIQIGTYTDMTKVVLNDSTVTENKNKAYNEIGPNGIGDWWAYNKNGSHTSWIGDSGRPDTNLTPLVTPDANGDRWSEWLAKKHYETIFAGMGFDFWYSDNNFWRPRSTADWNRDGVDDNINNLTVQGWWRSGQRAYYEQAAASAPQLNIIANADNDLSGEVYPASASPFNEFKNVLNGALLEHVMGVSWSVETWGGWEAMRGWYYEIFNNLLEPKIVMFGVYGAANDYQFFRYAFTSCLMNDGYFSYSANVDFQSYEPLPWFDEYDKAGTASTKWLGKAIDPPPTSAWQNGVYRRRYENGMAIVNPKGNGTRTVTVEPGYYRILGTQAPSVNNGQPAGTITLQDRDGIILMK